MDQQSTITISPEDEAFIVDRVGAGHFCDANAVVSAGLKLLEERMAEIAELRALISEGNAAIAKGDSNAYEPGPLGAELRAELLNQN